MATHAEVFKTIVLMINATAICLGEKGIKNTVGENKQIVNYIKDV